MRPSIITPTLVAAAATLATLAHGCGSGGGGGGGGGSIPLAAFGGEYAKALCGRFYSCCDAIERGSEPDLGPTEADCVARQTAELSDAIAELQADVATGLTRYDGDAARRCLNGIAGLSCADYGLELNIERIPDCLHAVEGTLPLGAACSSGDECVTHICDANPAGTGLACIAFPGPGEPCFSAGGCQPGLYCAFVNGAPTTCAVPQPVGSPCEEDAACANNNCPPPTTEPRTCSLPLECNGV